MQANVHRKNNKIWSSHIVYEFEANPIESKTVNRMLRMDHADFGVGKVRRLRTMYNAERMPMSPPKDEQ